MERELSKKKQRTETKKDAKRIKSEFLQWAMEKNEWLDGTIIISYFFVVKIILSPTVYLSIYC